MVNHNRILYSVQLIITGLSFVYGQANELKRIFQDCHRRSTEFDGCIKNAFNQLQPFFKSGEFKSNNLDSNIFYRYLNLIKHI